MKHSDGIVHNDLNPSNILINASCDVAISNYFFGKMNDEAVFYNPNVNYKIHCYFYVTPEKLFDQQIY